jgi:hypothetical protein
VLISKPEEYFQYPFKACINLSLIPSRTHSGSSTFARSPCFRICSSSSEDLIIDENRTDLYFEGPIYQHATFGASHVLYFHFAPYMKPYFDLIQGMEPLLADCQLKEKYHHHFFLELYEIFKVLGLTCWKPILVDRIMNRVQEEMISDLHSYLSKSTFKTVNDIIYDELIGMPIFGGVQKLSEM